jgi:hypothetical protein
MILTRAELGLDLGPHPDLPGIAASPSQFNPFAELAEVVGGNPRDLTQEALALQARRGRFVLGNSSHGDAWNDLVAVTADDVYHVVDLRTGRGGSPFYSLEADLNHPGSNSGLVIAGGHWTPPHRSLDAHGKELQRDEAVIAVHHVFPAMVNWMQREHGVSWEPALPKPTEAAIRLGLFGRGDLIHVKPTKRGAAPKGRPTAGAPGAPHSAATLSHWKARR